VWGEISRKVRKRALTPFQRDEIMTRLAGGTTYEGFDRADIVIEAVFEDLELKRKILAETEAAVRDDCVFASNTSALPISDIAAQAKRPERVLGMHYFSPVPKMPLLEIIVTDRTDDRAEATALELGIRQGKTVIVVRDGPGFYTTRILAPLLHEALLLLEEGADAMQIDRAMKRFGYPVGPIKLLDEVGIDVGAHVTRGVLGRLFEDKGITPTDALVRLDQAGFKGRKSKKGFYVYEDRKIKLPLMGRKRREINREVYRFFGGEKRKPFEDPVISGRLSLLMVNEAVRCLEDGIIREPRDGDIGAVFGLGFPPFRGGPFRYVDAEGAGAVLSMMEGFRKTCGRRFEPASLLAEHARSGKRFYPR
jgi:3-hydroxyacyl-CoA dehydrogenase/enoyl-CoA hydratase/3-hydroxybutyryl-CoA epimerase